MKKATLILVILLVIYTILSFFNLGRTKNPSTLKQLDDNKIYYLSFDKEKKIKKLMVYVGPNIENLDIFLADSNASKYAYYPSYEFDYTSVFKWMEIDLYNYNKDYSWIGIVSRSQNNYIGEIAALDENNDLVKLSTKNDDEKFLVDEQDVVPKESNYLNSTYFDEVYHVRTAYEQVNNIRPYECVHPPLGKLIISLGITIFGVNPFGYRVMGNIAGILMILVMFFIGKELFKKDWYGLISASIMAFDGMHFVQTRIGTVDSFLVLFCLTSFLFLIKYINLDYTEPIRKKARNLLLSGIFIGLAIATKWTAFFIGLGLAMVFLIHFIYNIIKNKKITKKDFGIILLCVLFFIIIPICIYLLVNIPLFINKECSIKDFKSLVDYQKNMYEYHSKLTADHPFTSPWYMWPILYKPMWYYVKRLPNNMVSTISCMGNPLIWWIGTVTTVLSLLWVIFNLKKDNRSIKIILIMIASSWLPYMFIGRVMFIYHYFITLPFVMFTITFILSKIEEKLKKKYVSIAVLFLFLVCFIIFYPVYSGKVTSTKYIDSTKWLDSWIY